MLETGIAKAIRLAEGQSALARLIGCTPQCVQRWFVKGMPSPKGSRLIEKVLGGQITRAELNPIFA